MPKTEKPWDIQKRPLLPHTNDGHCNVDPETNLCRQCGVDHSGPACVLCGGLAFHEGGCPEVL